LTDCLVGSYLRGVDNVVQDLLLVGVGGQEGHTREEVLRQLVLSRLGRLSWLRVGLSWLVGSVELVVARECVCTCATRLTLSAVRSAASFGRDSISMARSMPSTSPLCAKYHGRISSTMGSRFLGWVG